MEVTCPVSCREAFQLLEQRRLRQMEDPADKDCHDMHAKCKRWADQGNCVTDSGFMELYCRTACSSCDEVAKDEFDDYDDDDDDFELPSDETDVTDLTLSWSESFGVRQELLPDQDNSQILRWIERTLVYMETLNETQSLSPKLLDACRNLHPSCTLWALQDECERNPAYMYTHCAPACLSCEMMDFKTRCPPPNETLVHPALQNGHLDNLFERIIGMGSEQRHDMTAEKQRELVERGLPEYSSHVLSSPRSTDVRNGDNPNPWVVVLDDFLSDEECDVMIKLGFQAGYKRSKEVVNETVDGTFESAESENRTSENAWCLPTNGCQDDEMTKRITERMEYVTGIPANHSEPLQILKYEVGQFYKPHNDYKDLFLLRAAGPRILTFFLYLSDVENGGGTRFPRLDLTVQPKRGRALIWPSVLDTNLSAIDDRMEHEALEVVQGTKFAANVWIHLYDYMTPFLRGCN